MINTTEAVIPLSSGSSLIVSKIVATIRMKMTCIPLQKRVNVMNKWGVKEWLCFTCDLQLSAGKSSTAFKILMVATFLAIYTLFGCILIFLVRVKSRLWAY